MQRKQKRRKIDYVLPVFRIKKIRDKFLLVNEYGNWCGITKETLNQLIAGKISKKEHKLFENAGIILTKNNINHILNYLKEKYKILFGGPSLHIIFGTLRCNQKCVYCHASAKGQFLKEYDLNKKTAKKILEFIFQSPSEALTIEFQGGEPLLNEKIVKYVVNEAKKMNKLHKKVLFFLMTTNFTLMNKKLMDWLLKQGIQLGTSLDGNRDMHDLNRKYENGRNTYDDVVKWMEYSSKKYKTPSGALMVTTRKSLKRYKSIIDEYVKRGLHSIQLKPLNRIGYSRNSEVIKKIGYSAEEFEDFWKNGVDYILELNKKGIKMNERHILLILNKILSKREVKFMDFRSPCGAVIGQITYNYNGDIYSCDEGRSCGLFKMGNVNTHTLKDVVKSEAAKHLILSSMTESYACKNCIYQPFCGLCPVLTYSEQKNIIPKLPKSDICKLNKFRFDYVFEKLLFDKDAREIFTAWNFGKNHSSPKMKC